MVMTVLCNSLNQSRIPAALPCRFHRIHVEQNIHLQTATDPLHIFQGKTNKTGNIVALRPIYITIVLWKDNKYYIF
jgi:hypothetical protein